MGRLFRSALVRSLLLSILLCWSVSLALRGLGDLVPPVLRHEPARAAGPIAEIALSILLLVVWRFLWWRARLPRRAAVVLAAVVAVRFVGGFIAEQRSSRQQAASFGGLVTLAPNHTLRFSVAGGPVITYHTNAYGLRGPAFELKKSAGVGRIAVVGDSFVFGYGVELDDTLPRQLEATLARSYPERRFEVLNLGIQGDDLPSHVAMVKAAAELLDPDIVVLCLTLPGDLARWDHQDERRDDGRVSLFSVSRYLLGITATRHLWGYAFSPQLDADARRVLDEQVDRLVAVRKRAPGGAPPLLVFTYKFDDDEVRARLARLREGGEVHLIPPDDPDHPERYIPGDGHPSAAGNQRFSQLIAGALAEIPRFRELTAGGR